jgi:kinesin family protein 1
MAPTGGQPSGNIKVVVRVRPFNNRELDRNAKCIVQMKGDQTILQPPPEAADRLRQGKGGLDGQRTFKYDKSYWSFNKSDPHFAGQDNLFADLGSPLLDNAFQGYNNCIFAYGQTGSGKSYSMMGYGAEAGVIPQICRNMFERITSLQSDPNLTCTVEVSYLEIYNERVRDLLNPATKGNLRVREHPSTGPYVEDLAKLAVRSFGEIENLMDEGNKARTVAATNMNETSSRSHAVFTLTLTQKRHDVETRMDTEKVAKISLVDLAGSERATSTGATGARLKEGAEINRSLSTLGRVIAALADLSSGKKGMKVPYRDSVLTWLLKDSLGGNSLTAMIAAISPADINFEETLSTLRYADSAKRIKNHAVVNEDPNARMIRELKEELAQLRSKLGGGGVGIASEDMYPPGTPLDQQMVSITQADGSVKRVSKAEIQEQLSQSEKLYKDLNQTWEEKLQMTEEIHREREAALEELGISIEHGNVGLSTPKKMPHLVNLSDDPLLAECLVYNLKPGTTTVGNVEAETATEIRLNGSKIMDQHCKLDNMDNVVTLIPNDGAAVMVNGIRVDEPKRLKSGNRIILGDFHIFRFNNPLEAKAERGAQSLLRHSVTASQFNTPTRPGHDRSISIAASEIDGSSSRAGSPMFRGRDSDWSFARREAAGAMLGTDQKITSMTDDELDHLFENVQKAREERRGRPESRFFDHDDDSDDLSSFLVRDKYMSNGTIDNFSLDTALTMPNTPLQEHEEPADENDLTIKAAQHDMQKPLDEQKEDSEAETKAKEALAAERAELDKQKAEMDKAIASAKRDFEEQLKKQKETYEAQIKQVTLESRPKTGPSGYTDLTIAEMSIARSVVERWQQRNFIHIAELILQHAGALKEAQVMSKVMDKNVYFQFAILDIGAERASSYDLILHDISSDDDEALATARKPCLGVRVVDEKLSVIHLWSLEKLRLRLTNMRRMRQYIDQPEYLQHFCLENPFSESYQPLFSLVGEGSIPLTAVYETRVQDFSVEVVSPYTQNLIGKLRLSLEPSLGEAPLSTIKFNIVIRDMTGFPEHEGTNVHAQFFVSGASDEEGVATTQTVAGFEDGPIRFESIHSLSMMESNARSSFLKVSIYAQVTRMHLDKLASWDEIRESAERPTDGPVAPRLPESEYQLEERHDIFAKIQVLELAENGQYLPVEVVQASAEDEGVYQLHQGLQRRIMVTMTHSLTESLPWDDLKHLRVGEIHLIDSSGRIADLDSVSPDVKLKQTQEPMIKDNADGTSTITIVGQWDTSLHKSLLLDRATAEQCRIRFSVRWDIVSGRLEQPMAFSIEQHLRILPRSYLRPTNILKAFWNQIRITHSTDGVFSVAVRPISAKRAADLWRLDTAKDYINGEELLGSWSPRGISLVKDYMLARQKRRQLAEIEAAKGILGNRKLSVGRNIRSRTPSPSQPDARQEEILRKYVDLWRKPIPSMSNPIFDTNGTSNGEDGSARQPHHLSAASSPTKRPVGKTRYVATVTHQPKNPMSFKSGYLLMPSESQDSSRTHMQWKRRFVDLRPPYLHIHSVPDGDAINAINLTHARIDRDPDFKRLLGSVSADDSPSKNNGLTHVFAVYGEQNTFLFAARNETARSEWVLAIDQSYMREEEDDDAVFTG